MVLQFKIILNDLFDQNGEKKSDLFINILKF